VIWCDADSAGDPWCHSCPVAKNFYADFYVTDARFKRWIDSVGTVTLPLLAGFSITAVVVVSDDPGKFLWPGATILVLALAALVLIVAVQCAYHARVYLSKEDPDHEKGLDWVKWARRFYDVGLFALLIGLALVVAPHHVAGIQDYFRLAAVILALLACLGHLVWLMLDPWLGPRWAARILRRCRWPSGRQA
jgi:hypothetical protein